VNVGDVTVQRGRSGIAGFRLWHAGAAIAALLLAACTSSPPPVAPLAAVVAPVKPAETELPVAVAREHIACAGWRNVTVVQSCAEQAQIALTADAALFCAVHDIMQSPAALANVMTKLRPGAWVAAAGGKWAEPMLMGVNFMVSMLHAPYVRSFSGFDRPWRHLEQLLQDVRVQEIAFGSGYIMTGHLPVLGSRC